MLESLWPAGLRPINLMASDRAASVACKFRHPPRREVSQTLHESLCIARIKAGRAYFGVGVVKQAKREGECPIITRRGPDSAGRPTSGFSLRYPAARSWHKTPVSALCRYSCYTLDHQESPLLQPPKASPDGSLFQERLPSGSRTRP